MIAAASPAKLMGVVALAAVISGAFILLHLVVRQVKGHPLVERNPEPFRMVRPLDLLTVAVGLFVLYMGCGLLVSARSLRGGPLGVVGILAGLAAGVWAYRAAVRKVVRPASGAGLQIGQGAVVAWASLPVVYGASFLVTKLGGSDQPQRNVQFMFERGEGWQYLAVYAVVVAPLLEEIVFRGLLYPALRRRWGVFAAVVVTSVLFGLVHGQANVVMPLALFGVFLAYLVENSGSLLPCIAAHAAFNLLTVLPIFAAG